MKKNKPESGRQAYIRLLRHRADDIDSLSKEDREHFLWADLIAAGYLDGHTVTNERGVPSGNIIRGPTVEGRLFLQKLEEEEESETWKGKFFKYSLPVITFFAGIVSSVLIDWLKKLLGVES